MKWSKAKKKFESLLAPCLQSRLEIHITKYRETKNFDLGKGWITLDSKTVVSIMIPSFYSDNFLFRTDTMNSGGAVISYVNMNIDEIKEFPDEIINSLMFLDKRIGKRFIQKTDSNSLHPFAQKIYRLRCELENISTY